VDGAVPTPSSTIRAGAIRYSDTDAETVATGRRSIIAHVQPADTNAENWKD
jgi:hypothetical protein